MCNEVPGSFCPSLFFFLTHSHSHKSTCPSSLLTFPPFSVVYFIKCNERHMYTCAVVKRSGVDVPLDTEWARQIIFACSIWYKIARVHFRPCSYQTMSSLFQWQCASQVTQHYQLCSDRRSSVDLWKQDFNWSRKVLYLTLLPTFNSGLVSPPAGAVVPSPRVTTASPTGGAVGVCRHRSAQFPPVSLPPPRGPESNRSLAKSKYK